MFEKMKLGETGHLPRWRQPVVLLFLMAAAMPVSFGVWQALLNNFAIERAAFSGVEIGILQSLREIPGFLAFGAVLLVLAERRRALSERRSVARYDTRRR